MRKVRIFFANLFYLDGSILFWGIRMDDDLRKILNEIKAKVDVLAEEARRNREIQEKNRGLAPKFVESSPSFRTYRDHIQNLFKRHPTIGYIIQPDEVICIMGHFDHMLLNELTPVANRIRIVSPADTVNRSKNKDALIRMSRAGAQVRLHPMLHARIFCVPKRNFLIIGSGDIQTDCFGGARFDAGVLSNNPELTKDAMEFFDRVWKESEPLNAT